MPLDGLPLLGLRLSVTLALATLSYRFVEVPIRNGAIGRSWRGLHARPGQATVGRAAAWSLALALSLTVIGAGVVVKRRAAPPPTFAMKVSAQGARQATAARAQTLVAADASALTSTAPPAPTVAPTPPDPAATPAPPPDPVPVPVPVPSTAAPAVVPPVPVTVPAGKVTAIGESVLMEVQEDLAAALGDFTLNAAVGRQMGATVAAVHRLRDSGSLGEVVLVQVGNNGVVTAGEFDELMDMLSGARRVVVVNVKVPRPWEEPNNDVLAAGVTRWHNAMLLDWHRLGSDHPDWFLSDGVHLQTEATHLFAQFLLSGL